MQQLKKIFFDQQDALKRNDSAFKAVHEQVLNTYGKNALAIVVYGSCLSQTTQKKDSVPDYFVIVDSFQAYYSSLIQSSLNTFLPPNIYHFAIEQGFSKYSVVSLKQLQSQTQLIVSPKAKDMYFLGRFSKNTYIYWSQDTRIKDALLEVQNQACQSVAMIVLSSMNLGDKISLNDFALKCLALSYVGDVRVEAKDKVEKLFLAEEKFYLSVYQEILCHFHQQKIISFDQTQKYLTLLDKTLLPKKYKRFILKSKLRAQLRWPKGMLTAKNWLDYVLLKIRRNYGDEFTLTEREKKYWFIFGWKLLFKLNRKKLLK
ncbi:MAG TPA: hypothetical protein PKC21_00170 [Oligoflexia bacterium]|nr:hypothetical protein [Oligoflexia bacterium]HMR23741.1 hypothetical protein [Oligoflexia bacterium]